MGGGRSGEEAGCEPLGMLGEEERQGQEDQEQGLVLLEGGKEQDLAVLEGGTEPTRVGQGLRHQTLEQNLNPSHIQ